MKKYGAHKLYLSADEVMHGPLIAVLDEKHAFQSAAPFQAEEAAVEWLGGIFVLIPEGWNPLPFQSSFGAWYLNHIIEKYKPKDLSYALWHIAGASAYADLKDLEKVSLVRLM